METGKDHGALLLVVVGIIVESRNVLTQENKDSILLKIKLLSFFVFHISLVFLNRSKLDVFHSFQKLCRC